MKGDETIQKNNTHLKRDVRMHLILKPPTATQDILLFISNHIFHKIEKRTRLPKIVI